MRLLVCLLSPFALLATSTHANTEKVIFIAPAPLEVLISDSPFDVSTLKRLTPSHTSLRTSLSVAFPTNDKPHGLDSWYLLSGLKQRQRHEVRICWVAIQPTNIWVEVFECEEVFDTPDLIQSLSNFSDSIRDPGATGRSKDRGFESVLLLRVQAAADFFTINRTLMQHPPLVDVDIIIDPYLANVFPTSLLPTAGYLLVLAIGSWYLSGAIWRFLNPPTTKEHDD